ncbi:MAG: DUF308 domain-containing protein [Treponema sp.]|nr:DUF308 domain-containing protein [Treponema sp.]
MSNLDVKKVLPYIYGALMVICGILIVSIPQFWIRFFVVVFGLAAIAYGIYEFVQVKDIPEDAPKYKKSILIKASVSVVFGVLSVIIPVAVADTLWKIGVYLFATGLIIVSALGFYSVSVLQETSPKRKQYIIENLALLVVAIVMFLISPDALGKTIIRIVGVIGIIAGLLWIVITAITKPGVTKDIVVEAGNVDVTDVKAETTEEKPVEITEEKSNSNL